MRRLASSMMICACALAMSAGAAFAEGPTLDIQEPGLGPGTVFDLNWGVDPANPTYLAYDVIQGNLPTLRNGIPAGDFSVAITACLIDNSAGPPFLGLPAPPPGGQFFFLVLAQSTALVCGAGSWDEAFAVPPFSQSGSRDGEIPLDAATCPCP